MAMTTPTTHHAPEFDDEETTACGQNVGYILAETDDEICTVDSDEFMSTENYCVDCAIELEVL